MDNAVVARFLKSHEAFELESPEVELEVAVELPDADEAVVLGGMGVMVEIDQVVDGGLLGAYAEGLVVVMKVETEVGGRMEVVLPAEMVGVILAFEPGGGLPFHGEVENQFAEVAFRVAEILSPAALQAEVADLVAQGDDLRFGGEVGGMEQVDNHSAGKNHL